VDPRVTEFHCIMPLGNIPSVLENGILSYERAAQLEHHSVAMPEVQERRDQKQVPGGLQLHQYANLYFHARNPMMSARRREAADLCVLRVSIEVRHEPGVVFSDCNAASGYARFLAPDQWQELHFDDILALDWRHPGDPTAYYRHKSRKCAEVLVPHCVTAQRLLGAYVAQPATVDRLRDLGFRLPVDIDPGLFFA
jgi:hypothetical protein